MQFELNPLTPLTWQVGLSNHCLPCLFEADVRYITAATIIECQLRSPWWQGQLPLMDGCTITMDGWMQHIMHHHVQCVLGLCRGARAYLWLTGSAPLLVVTGSWCCLR